MISKYSLYKITSILFLFFFVLNSNAQTGLNFQGVARSSNNIILASQNISIKLSILQGSSTGSAEYVETRKVMTNAQGLFSIVIGDTGTISTIGDFSSINWKQTPKFLKIEMDPAGGNNFITMGTTQFQNVAYAMFTKSVDAENIKGIVPVALGGTGVTSIAGLKSALSIDKISNVSDLAKPISTLTQAALDLKFNVADTIKYVKKPYLDSVLLTTLTTSASANTISNLTVTNPIVGNITGNAVTSTLAANISATTNTTLTTLTNLTSVGTLSNLTVTSPILGSITGNASTATLAANISATTNTSITSLSNLNTVGTITSGVWSGSTIAVSKGGTGLTSFGTSNQVLTSTGSGTLTWTTPIESMTHFIGETFGGGVVFYVTPDRKHGLIVETNDLGVLGVSGTWFEALDWISDTSMHNAAAKNYTDWRLPTKHELIILSHRVRENPFAFPTFANIAIGPYWSSNEHYNTGAADPYFFAIGVNVEFGTTLIRAKNISTLFVRGVRSF